MCGALMAKAAGWYRLLARVFVSVICKAQSLANAT